MAQEVREIGEPLSEFRESFRKRVNTKEFEDQIGNIVHAKGSRVEFSIDELNQE